MTESLEWTFAYGSNMNLDDLRSWFEGNGHTDARIERSERAVLPGYRLVWNYYSSRRGGGAANVEHFDGALLPGVALQVNREGFRAIDRKEGHPKYYSRGDAPVSVQLGDGSSIRAWLYVAVPGRCRKVTVPPTREYLDIIVGAAEHHGLPADHVEALRAIPTAEPSDG